jgi:hypothetical protein
MGLFGSNKKQSAADEQITRHMTPGERKQYERIVRRIAKVERDPEWTFSPRKQEMWWKLQEAKDAVSEPAAARASAERKARLDEVNEEARQSREASD